MKVDAIKDKNKTPQFIVVISKYAHRIANITTHANNLSKWLINNSKVGLLMYFWPYLPKKNSSAHLVGT